MKGLFDLIEALEADYDWIDRLNRLATRARDWGEGGRPANRLMSGADIAAAKALVETRKPNAPPILPVQLDFIQASEAHEAEQRSTRERELAERERLLQERETAVQQEAAARAAKAKADTKALRAARRTTRVTVAGLAAALLLAGAAGWLGWQAKETAGELQVTNVKLEEGRKALEVKTAEAVKQADLAKAASAEAERQSAMAREEAAKAEARRKETAVLREQTQITESGLLSETAKVILDKDAPSAMLLALEGMPDASAGVVRPLVSEAWFQLDQATRGSKERHVLAHGGRVRAIAFSANGRLLATGSEDNTARLIEASTGKELRPLAHDDPVLAVAFSPDGRLLATGSGEPEQLIPSPGTPDSCCAGAIPAGAAV